ncbi:MAG TPA: hypothetical protein VGN12_14770 [Pirellulales bacterium]|jgi:hypothetical protein
MTDGLNPLAYRRLRAPRGHGSVLVDPAVAQVPQLVTANVAHRKAAQYDVQGRSLHDLAEFGRRELVKLARSYTATYRNVGEPCASERLFLAGHQPELFHPGVWYKNFALSRLAREQQATAVNLVIDSDTIKHVSLRVPGGSLDEPFVDSIAFDSTADEIPFEEREIEDRGMFASFGTRTCKQLQGIVPEPLMRHYWPMALERAAATRNLGECLAQSRHVLEEEWGLHTLELPQSQVCALEAFHWFTAHLLANLPRLRDAYNSAVETYRRVNRVRSANHPVPNLATDGELIEAPFWLWSSSTPRRRRLFVRRHSSGMTLTDRRRVEFELPLAPDGDATRAVDVLASLRERGIKLRSRALVTTLFARLVLSDLFIHGIGGAKYDQLTDELIHGFFGISPPNYLVISATFHLAAAVQRAPGDVRRIDQDLRDLDYHPEKCIADLHDWTSAPVDIAHWLDLKARWLATEQTRENGRERCHAIRAANEALQAWVEPRRRELMRRRTDALREQRTAAVLTSREYGFCLYPADSLRDFLLAFRGTTL